MFYQRDWCWSWSCRVKFTLHKKRSFPLRISLVNVTKSAVSKFTEEILNGKLHFLCSVIFNKIVELTWTYLKPPGESCRIKQTIDSPSNLSKYRLTYYFASLTMLLQQLFLCRSFNKTINLENTFQFWGSLIINESINT